MAKNKITVEVVGDVDKLRGAFRSASKETGHFGQSISKVGKIAAVAFGAGMVTAAIGIRKAIDAASDLNEQVNKSKVVFGKSGDEVVKWSKGLAINFGISSRAALEASGTFGNMLVPMGFARDRAAEMSKRMVELAGDMSSFNNASPEDTLEAIRAGLAGESEPLRKFGVFLNDARLKQEALALGLYKGKGALDANAKAAATYSLILKDTKDAQGDFARTNTGLANSQRVIQASWENISASLGSKFLPVVAGASSAVAEFLTKFDQTKGADAKFRLLVDTLEKGGRQAFKAIGDAVKSINWTQVISTIRDGMYRAAEAGFKALREGISRVNWGALGRLIGQNVVIALQNVTRAIQSVNWGQAGKYVVDSIGKFLSNVDWRAVFAAAFKAMVAILKAQAQFMFAAAQEVGKAIIQGIAAGLEALRGYLMDKARSIASSVIGALKGALRIGSPSKVTAEEIGKPIAQGIGVGFIQHIGSTMQEMSVALGRATDGMRDKVRSAIDGWRSAWQDFSGAALAAFDDMASKLRTKSEKLLDELSRKSFKLDLKQAKKDIEDAAAELDRAKLGVRAATATGDPDAQKAANAALFDAQMAFDRAVLAQQELVLSAKAAKERKALDDQIAVNRMNFEQYLASRSTAQQRALIQEGNAQQAIVEKIRSYGPLYRDAGAKIGKAIAKGLDSAAGDVAAAIARLTDKLNALLKLTGQVQSASSNAGSSANGGKRALGGPVVAGKGYIVGENGPEFFMPNSNGRIIPNAANNGPTVAMGGGGGNTYQFNFPNYIGSQQELVQTVHNGLLEMKRRDGNIGL